MVRTLVIAVLGAGFWVLGAGAGFDVRGSLNPELRTRIQQPQPGTPNQNPAPQNPAPRTAASAPTPARDLVTRYCVACHNEKMKAGNLALTTADADRVFNSAETWEKVIIKLRTRAMPPPGNRRPDSATYDAVSEWLEREIDREAAAHPNPGRPADLHRLNRSEYANAVRDLLGIEIDGASMLPPDEQAHGFDTNADALTVVPALLDRYLTAAAKISRMALGDPSLRPGFERYTAIRNNSNERTWLWQTERLGEEFPLGSKGGISARHYFPVDAEYVFRVRLDRTYTGLVRGLNVPNEIEIRVDGVRVGHFTLGGPEFGAAAARASAPDYQDASNPLFSADAGLEARVPVKAGLRQVTVTVVNSEAVKPEGLGPARIPIWGHDYDGDIRAPIVVSLLLIGGPYNGQVPQDSPSRRGVLICSPKGAADELPCAMKILTRLARRAYRRPATSEDIQTLVDFYKQGRTEGDFEAGIRAALERVLVSPDFLFRIEADPPAVERVTAARASAGAGSSAVTIGVPYRLSGVELASRLSFFLWSSAPDDELLDLAIDGTLRDTKVLDEQVRRMLRDPRARRALVDNFFSQWLQVRNVWLLTPDANRKFPWFDDNLRTAFVRETELFLESQLQEDRSVIDLLTADYTFLNERLARHYGIRNVYGSHFRRVALVDQNRWGLLGKASVLAVTSYPHRTSPTIRGKWLLENILAAPVPPPPPTVNTTLEEEKALKTASVREMLEQHRTNPVCASCHARMDPLGFSLENFDALGKWRTHDGGAAINPSGVLLDGTKVDGPAALRQALVSQKDQFVKAVAGKLLMYGVGRQMEYFDAPAIRAIVRSAAADDYRWSSMILAIVKSTPFQLRTTKQTMAAMTAERPEVAKAQAVGVRSP
jgi:mono/diheme cytochrome c family protein